jgi:hypothetical protein
MRKQRNLRAAVIGLLGACALTAVAASEGQAIGSGSADSGTVYLATTHTAHGINFAAGNATDKLFGSEAVTYSIRAQPTKTGSVKLTVKPVTTWGRTGTLTGTATATLTVAANGAATITQGKLFQAKGTGGWTGHSVTATFSGVGNATTGLYKITYKGTYK